MPTHPARLAPLPAAALALLAMAGAGMADGAPAGTAARAAAVLDRAAGEDEASLAVAQDRSARAEAAVDTLKRALTPGHLTDPMPDADRPFALETLRADYDDMQRKAAGYRATLGEQHPTLSGAEQVLVDLKRQLLDGTRKGLASAERNAAEARAGVGTIERRLAARAARGVSGAAARPADATGSIAPAALPSPVPASRPVAGVPPAAPRLPERESPVPPRAALSADRLSRVLQDQRVMAALAACTLLAVLRGALQLVRGRRPPSRSPSRRVEPALTAAAPRSDAPTPVGGIADARSPRRRAAADVGEAVPVLATFSLPSPAARPGRGPGPATHRSEGASAAAAAGLHATLEAASAGGPGARMTVLVTATQGLPGRDVDGAALTLALAAAAAGRRVALMEARPVGRLRRDIVPASAMPMLIEAGGVERTLYRLDAGGLAVAVLPGDAGEAEAAAAARRPETLRLNGLEAFDTIVLLGDDAPSLARAVDVVLIVAPAGAAPDTLAAAARPCRAAGRVCGALLVERPAATVQPRSVPAARRRSMPDPAQGRHGAAAVGSGLHDGIEPPRRRLVG